MPLFLLNNKIIMLVIDLEITNLYTDAAYENPKYDYGYMLNYLKSDVALFLNSLTKYSFDFEPDFVGTDFGISENDMTVGRSKIGTKALLIDYVSHADFKKAVIKNKKDLKKQMTYAKGWIKLGSFTHESGHIGTISIDVFIQQ